MKLAAIVILTCGAALAVLAPIIASKSDSASSTKWEAGFVDAIADEKRCKMLESDIARADSEVWVTPNEHLDVGRIRNGSLDEFQDFFVRQPRKDFIVVKYGKSAPHGDMATSLDRLKNYFRDAGYKRILLLHAHSSGWIVHEDFRPAAK